MINIELEIFIRSNKTVVWAFMSDITKGLSQNRYHSEIISESHRAVPGLEFQVRHKIFFRESTMKAVIRRCMPPDILVIEESLDSESDLGFFHQCTYQLKKDGYGTRLNYHLEGSYGNVLLDLPFKPILKVTSIEELLRIKRAIESSQPRIKLNPQGLEPV